MPVGMINVNPSEVMEAGDDRWLLSTDTDARHRTGETRQEPVKLETVRCFNRLGRLFVCEHYGWD
jgi:hypothetical protein